MKKFSYLLIVILAAISFPLKAQRGNMHDDDRPRRLEQFERLKLLEILDMDEEVAVKFFTRRKEYKENLRDLHKKIDEVSKKLEDILLDSKSSNRKEDIQKQIDLYFSLETQITRMKQDFANSIRELLTDEQLAKYTIFEIRFPREIQKLILENRKGMRQ